MNHPEISIIIVCMNNLGNLLPCLKSIHDNTTIECEIIVVAYLFSQENLKILRQSFPNTIIIESNEIRGFSENNNLALRIAKGKYLFVLNDDTILRSGCIDNLYKFIDQADKRIAIVSPDIFDYNGELAISGRPELKWYSKISNRIKSKRYESKHPIQKKNKAFKTFNILGAAFMIRAEVFEMVGWFDEYYFFSPEDIALSTHLNMLGYECWVNPKAELIHLEGMTSGHSISPIKIATAPAALKGNLYFYGKVNPKILYPLIWLSFFGLNMLQTLYQIYRYCIDKNEISRINMLSGIKCFKSLFSSATPKDLFIEQYRKL